MKNQYIGLQQFANLRAVLVKKRNGVFEEGGIDIPMHTMGKVGT